MADTVATTILAELKTPNPTPSPLASVSPAPLTAPIGQSSLLPPFVSIGFFVAVIIALVIVMAVIARRSSSSSLSAETDKSLEASRIKYGFWLIVCALVLILAIVIVVLSAIAPGEPKTTDIVAMITAATGVIGTLVAAFFGIQAAGAGRSQALTALSDQIKSRGPDGTATPYKIDPLAGPPAGGTRVSITGNGFTNAKTVNFGTIEGLNFERVNDGLVRANAPPAPDGLYSARVSVIFDGQTPPNKDVGTFYYYDIQPSHGDPTLAPLTVTIKGAGLKTVNAVLFGIAPGTNLNITSETSLTVTLPNGTKGADVPVTIQYPVSSSTNSFMVGQFHYD